MSALFVCLFFKKIKLNKGMCFSTLLTWLFPAWGHHLHCHTQALWGSEVGSVGPTVAEWGGGCSLEAPGPGRVGPWPRAQR